jgi:hypothetical protein
MTKHTPLRPKLRSVGGGRPLRDVSSPPGYRPPLQAPAWRESHERARLDREYALLWHKGRRRLHRLTLIPHGCLAFLAWNLNGTALVLALLFTVTFATHLLVAFQNRPPYVR